MPTYRNALSFFFLEKLFFLSFYCCIPVLFFLDLYSVFYVFLALSFARLLTSKDFRIPNLNDKNRWPYLFMLLFVGVNVFSILYSENTYESVKKVEKLSPLFLVAVLGTLSPPIKIDKNRFFCFILNTAIGITFISYCYALYLFFEGHYLAVGLVKGFENINLLGLFEHRLYSGILLLMFASFLLKRLFTRSKIKDIIFYVSILAIIFYTVYSTGARILALAIASMVFIHIVLIKKPFRKKSTILIMTLLLMVLSALIYWHPRTYLTLDLLRKGKDFEKLDNRVVIWKDALQIINENPFFGTGIGDWKDELLQSYKNSDSLFQYENTFNVHNQFLQTTLETGVIGLLTLLLFFISLLFVRNNKRHQLVTMFVLFGMGCMIESMLSRNLGTIPLAFWLYALLSTDLVEIKNKKSKITHKTLPVLILLLSMTILACMIFLTNSQSLDMENPRTYMSVPHKIEVPESIPKREQLPYTTKAARFSDLKNFQKYEKGYFIAPELYRSSQDRCANINFGIWCYMSENSNVYESYIYAWNKLDRSIVKKYDLNKKGTWQYLQIENVRFDKSFSLGVRAEFLKESSKIEGDLLFALPEYHIKACEENE